MSIAVGTALTAEPRSFSLGPWKTEIQTIDVVSGDTGATITAKSLSQVAFCTVHLGPVVLTAQPTFSGAVVTLAFTDPAASRFGSITLYGR